MTSPNPRAGCGRCAHAADDHDNLVGCHDCKCAATRNEAHSLTPYVGEPRPYDGPAYEPGRYLHDWQRPDPTPPPTPPPTPETYALADGDDFIATIEGPALRALLRIAAEHLDNAGPEALTAIDVTPAYARTLIDDARRLARATGTDL